MTKVVIKAGSVYPREYVVELEDAMAIMNILKMQSVLNITNPIVQAPTNGNQCTFGPLI